MQPVIRAFKLQNLVATGRRARDAAGVHGHFRAARTEAHHLHGIALADFFRQLPFLLVRHAESGALVQLLFDSFHHRRMTVPGHQRSETQIVIDVFVPIDVVNSPCFAVFHKNGIRLVMPVVAGNSQGNSFQGPFVRRRGFGRALFVRGNFLLQFVVHGTSPSKANSGSFSQQVYSLRSVWCLSPV